MPAEFGSIVLPTYRPVNGYISRAAQIYAVNSKHEFSSLLSDTELDEVDFEVPERKLYLPPHLGRLFESSEIIEAYSEGGRGAILEREKYSIPYSFLGLDGDFSQEFFLSLKGIGHFMRTKLELDSELVICRDAINCERPFGGESFEDAKYSVEISKTLIELNKKSGLGIKFAPVFHAVKIPPILTDGLPYYRMKSGQFFGKYGFEIRVMPSQIRAGEGADNFKFLKCDTSQIVKLLFEDFRHHLEVIPKTMQKSEGEVEWLSIGFNDWPNSPHYDFDNAKDIVLTQGGAWFVDLESVVMQRNAVERISEVREMQEKCARDVFDAFYRVLINVKGIDCLESASPFGKTVTRELSKSEFLKVENFGSPMRISIDGPAFDSPVSFEYSPASMFLD